MKYILSIILFCTSSMIANSLDNTNKIDYLQIKNACVSGDANACNSLGKIYLDVSNEKKANSFVGIALHQKACELKNNESCEILNDFKNKNLTSLMSENELKIFKAIVKQEIDISYDENTKPSIFDEFYLPKKEHIVATSNTLQLDYEKNEVGADLKYKNKDIVASGQVLKISKDAFGSIYLDLKGGTNQFMTPKAYIEKDYIDWASRLSKNDNVKLYCEKSSMVVGSAILNDCKPLDVAIEEKANIILSAIDKSVLNSLKVDWMITGM